MQHPCRVRILHGLLLVTAVTADQCRRQMSSLGFLAPALRSHSTRSVNTCRSQRLYMSGNNGKDNNKDRLDDMYYQRFMGLGETYVSDDVASELGQLDPSGIDSLRVEPPESETRRSGGVSSGSSGFLSSVKSALPGGNSMENDMMMGPRAYIIPQSKTEAPLEIRSVAPNQRRGDKGVIAEIPGRKPSAWTRQTMDISRKVEDVKRTIKEAPTRLSEIQINNLRDANPSRPSSSSSMSSQNSQFSFPSFPAAGQSGSSSSDRGSSSMRRSRKGKTGKEPQTEMQKLAKDWRAWVGLIAGVSFVTALINAMGHRSELIVMNEGLQELLGVGAELERLMA